MNRIEEIKRKIDWSSYHGDISANEVEADVEYLLAKLEMAEKALARIEDHWEANITVKTYARDALKDIRS
jgi:hypothetical protein